MAPKRKKFPMKLLLVPVIVLTIGIVGAVLVLSENANASSLSFTLACTGDEIPNSETKECELFCSDDELINGSFCEPISSEPIIKDPCTEEEFIESNGECNMDGGIEPPEVPPAIEPPSQSDIAIENFLSSLSFVDARAIGIETIVLKKDIAGNIQEGVSILPVPFSISTGEDPLFFPSELEARFFAISQESTSALNLEGTVEIFIDQNLIETKKLFVSTNVINENQIPLFVVDTVPPPFDNRPDSFEFLFSDEGFVDDSNHVFRIIIKDVTGTLNQEPFSWTGEFIAYEMQFNVNEELITVINEEGNVVEVLKSDTIVKVCAGSNWEYKKQIAPNPNPAFGEWDVPEGPVLFKVEVFENIGGNVTGALVGEVLPFSAPVKDVTKKIGVSPSFTCKNIEGLQRDTDYIIIMEHDNNHPSLDKAWFIKTPMTQHDYEIKFVTTCRINCSLSPTDPPLHYTYAVGNFEPDNFGYLWTNLDLLCNTSGTENPKYPVNNKYTQVRCP